MSDDLPYQALTSAYRQLDSLHPGQDPERYARALAEVERARTELGDRLWAEMSPARRQDFARRLNVLRQHSGGSFSWSSDLDMDEDWDQLPEQD